MAHGKWWVITSILFLASFSFAQVPTPIRSVSSLPATCKGGSSTQSSDMVVLIVAGVGTNYLCTAPNTWTAVLGGSGSPPGGSLGTTQFNATSTVFGGTIGEVDASAFTGADICAQIEAAIAALPAAGGTVKVPAGNWAACSGTGGVGITISKNSVILEGMGWLTQLVSPQGATTLNFAAGVTGIDLHAGSVIIRNLNLVSADTGANSDDGIRVRGGVPMLDSISVSHFGGNGIAVIGQPPNSADSWHFTHLQSYLNFGDGYQWSAPCSDNNLGIGDILSASNNGGWGFNFQCGVDNVLNSPLAQGNTLGGYNIQASFNTFNQVYCEGGTGSSFIIGSGLPNFVSSTYVSFKAFGQCATIDNSGGAAALQEIHYSGPDNWNVQNGLFIAGQPGITGNKAYWLAEGDSPASQLSLNNISDGVNIFTYDPANKFTFNQKVTFTAGTFGTGGSAPVDIQNVTPFTIPSSDAGSLLINLNVGATSWTGPALTNNINFSILNFDGPITYTPSAGAVNGDFTQLIPNWWFATEFTDNFSTAMAVMPTLLAFPDCQDVGGNHLNFTLGTGTFTCGSGGGGGGSVTHTGALTAGKMVIGNGVDDVTIDTNVAADGSGNVTLLSVQTTGLNGGFTGVEGDGSGLTAGATIDLLYPDSTSHCWHQNNNNVDRGCVPGSSGAGIGSYIGTPVVADFSQASQASFLMRLHNVTADGTSKGGITMLQTDAGDFIIDKNNDAGTTVTGNLTFFQDGSLEVSGNGDATNGQTSVFTILNSSTVDFQLSPRTGKTGVTGSPRLIWKGRTSGQAAIKVADAAGTPNDIQLPSATGTSGQVLQTDGGNPQVTSWVTRIKSYNHSGTEQTVSHLVQDSCVLGTSCAVTLTSTAVYTNSTSYTCVCQDDTAIAACSVAQSSGSAFTITGTGTDTIRYQCLGN